LGHIGRTRFPAPRKALIGDDVIIIDDFVKGWREPKAPAALIK
jgi:hypothetical protein